jgi:hypothetical protein
VETLEPNSKNPAKVTLKGECNTWSSTYYVYFQYWENSNPWEISYTSKKEFSSSSPVEFSEELNLHPNTSYMFRAICETPWGTFWGGIKGISLVHVLVPNGGENWAIGETRDIQWESWGVSENVNIWLSRDGGSNWEQIATNIPVTDGKYSWNVSGPETSLALIKVESASNPSIFDTSDNVFTISLTISPWIRVVSPNGGENWAIGETRDIQWESWGVSENVNIWLSRDGGSNWEQIATNIPVTDGKYSWNVSGPETSLALIKVESASNPSIFDVSDATFTISTTP